MAANVTPVMQQYLNLKARYPTEILFFRLGDFYELFGEDAKKCSPVLEVALTHRQQEPMCGVPAHSVEPYIAKLLKAGLRVAIADQMEDPSATKGLVKRDVVRVISAGTLQEDGLLSAKENNFLIALAPEEKMLGLAAIECSTGEFFATELPPTSQGPALWDELSRLAPSEVILPSGENTQLLKTELQRRGYTVAELLPIDFSEPLAEERLKKTLQVSSVRGFGLEGKPQALSAAGGALRYLENMQCGRAVSLKPLHTYSIGDSLQMDAATLDHLDLLPQPGDEKNARTLLQVLDHTLTPMGGRLLRRWLVAPLRQVEKILERQNQVNFFLEQKLIRRQVRDLLIGWPDMERILSRLAAGTTAPRDLAHLAAGLTRLPELQRLLPDCPSHPDLAAYLARAIVDTPPPTLKDGGVIRDGFHAELDEVRSWIRDGKTRLLELEKKEREATGIQTLKVGFNNIFGYFLEVTKSNVSRVPPHYHRKQTTANGERYITPELKEYENRILGSEERALRLETALIHQIREEILRSSALLRQIADAIAQQDVFLSLAEAAERHHYVRPSIEDSAELSIQEGRHPVLDDVLPAGTLVANDLELDAKNRQILILTGPNMSGKSTYLRQTALIVVMAQMGSFVPAKTARIGIVDALYTRIGASDRLTEGESTFMVEMVETARILNHATPRSLVILDEVGRGTSTYDGMAIAGACLEYLYQQGPKVLFATHFFELTDMDKRFPRIANAHVTAREWKDQVVFLHKVEAGPADRAYGIHVARLAGVPKAVLDRAGVLLKELEEAHAKSRKTAKTSSTDQLSFFEKNDTLPASVGPI